MGCSPYYKHRLCNGDKIEHIQNIWNFHVQSLLSETWNFSLTSLLLRNTQSLVRWKFSQKPTYLAPCVLPPPSLHLLGGRHWVMVTVSEMPLRGLHLAQATLENAATLENPGHENTRAVSASVWISFQSQTPVTGSSRDHGHPYSTHFIVKSKQPF